ncbi:MAG: phosphoribosylformylglycinamidine cyclo-ligase [Lentisphaeria bacterium]|nr:phosphoribosylformylglycinamidine cyclo-ligase [Lentisphaeria bacterium]
MASSDRYAEAGVDIDLAGKLLSEVKGKIAATKRPEVLAPVGGFGGLFQLDLSKYNEPVIVSSVDGVGTKLMVANAMNDHRFVGHDIVNHCINDIIVQGAEPLYFLDYIGIGKLRSPLYEEVLSGLAEACAKQSITLLGGETAEMPGLYGDDYDLVGSITGVVSKSKLISGDKIQQGDVILGMSSNGPHTNGYSLARKVLFEEAGYEVNTVLAELEGETVGSALLKPHVCYWPVVKQILERNLPLHGLAHITGGGFYDNVPRVLPENVDAVFEKEILAVPPIFKLIEEKGKVSEQEMYRVFNMGVGMMLILPAEHVDEVCELATQTGFPIAKIGEITSGSQSVKIKGIDC